MAKSADDVVIRLSREKALALFEWAYRFMETQDQRFTHPADAVVIDNLAGELERTLAELFMADYSSLLAAARTKIETEYRDAIGPEGSAWLATLAYQDVPTQ